MAESAKAVSITSLVSGPARHGLLVAGGYSLFFLVFFSPVVFSSHVLAPGDGLSYFLPNFYARAFLWDSSIWVGFPAVGDAQRMFWYPPAFVFSLLPRSWDLFIIAAYVFAASFTYGYTFTVTRSRLAGAISGLTFGLCGFMIAHLGHAAVAHTTAWLPLIVWSYSELATRSRFSRAWFGTATLAIACAAVAGHPQMFTYIVLLSGLFALARGFSASMPRLRYYLICGLTIVIGLGVAAVQLAPTAELTPYTLRAALSFEEFVAYQLPLRQLPMIIFPFLYGGSPSSFYSIPYFGAWPSSADGWGASELTGYVGLLPLILAAVGVVLKRRNAMVLFWCAVAVVALMLVVGGSTPLARLTYHLPVINKFRAPARYFFAFGFAVSVLGGLGVSGLLKGELRRALLTRTVLLAVTSMLAVLVMLQLLSGKINELAIQRLGHGITLNPFRNASILVPAILLLAGAGTLLLWHRLPTSRVRSALLLFVLLADLSSFAWFYEWRYRSPYSAYLRPPAAAESYNKQIAETHQRVLPVRGGLGQVSEVPPDLSKLWSIPSASGYGPFVLTRLNRLLKMPPHGTIDNSWREPGNQSLDLLGVRYILLPENEPEAPSKVDERGLHWSVRDFSDAIGQGCVASTPLSSEILLPQPMRATRIGVVGTLACSVGLPNGVEFGRIITTNAAGDTQVHSLRAGEHFSEWAWDCSDVKPAIQHQRAVVFSSQPTERGAIRCEAHDYVAFVMLGQAQGVTKISLNWTGPSATFALRKITMIDDERRVSVPVNPPAPALNDAARWRYVGRIDHSNSDYGTQVKAEDVGASHVYENLLARPRVWLVSEVRQVTDQDALNAIRTSWLPDGGTFDPARLALVEETPPVLSSGSIDSNSTARVRLLTNDVMEVETRLNAGAFLVTSDTNYPGWKATIDGEPAKIYQTDYLLRGVTVPAGSHVVRFEFRPRSFYVGASVSVLSLLVLIGLCVRRPSIVNHQSEQKADSEN